MHLNHPKTIPPLWSMEKLSSMKPVPGAKRLGTTGRLFGSKKSPENTNLPLL